MGRFSLHSDMMMEEDETIPGPYEDGCNTQSSNHHRFPNSDIIDGDDQGGEDDENDHPNLPREPSVILPSASRLFRSSSVSSISSAPSLLERTMSRIIRPSRGRTSSLEAGEIPEDIDGIPEEYDEDDYYHNHHHENDSCIFDDGPSSSRHARQLIRYDNDPLQQRDPQDLFSPSFPSAPIHYHIYYTPSETPSNAGGSSNLAWKCIAFVAVLSHVIYLYGPASPPPLGATQNIDHSSWQDFVSHQSQAVMGILTTWSSVAHYVAVWCWQGMVDDWRFWNLDSSVVPVDSSSAATIPNDCSWKSIVTELPIFGQETALKGLQQSIQTHVDNRPLVVYATGGPGVGKRYLARLLAEKQQESCPIQYKEPALLEIDLDDLDQHDENSLISSRIRNHVQSHYPHGSILLFSHCEPNTTDMTSETSMHRILFILNDLLQDSSQPDDLWNNVLIIFTSSLGASSIDKTIRYYHGIDGIPVGELTLYLRQQWLEEMAPSIGLDMSSSPSTVLLLEKAAILPFWPLNREAAQNMLPYQLQQAIGRGIVIQQTSMDEYHDSSSLLDLSSSSSTITTTTTQISTMDYLLDHTLEWQSWIHKSTQTELYTFIPRGGSDVTWLVSRLLPPTENVACWDGINFHHDTNDDEQLWLDMTLSSFVGVKSSSSSSTMDDVWLRLWICPSSNKHYHDNKNDIIFPNDVDCRELCHYALV